MSDLKPFFKFYARDWLSDEKVRALSQAACGVFINILALMWKSAGCEIKNDPEYICNLIGFRESREKRTFAEVWAELMPDDIEGQIFKINDGKLWSKRLREERQALVFSNLKQRAKGLTRATGISFDLIYSSLCKMEAAGKQVKNVDAETLKKRLFKIHGIAAAKPFPSHADADADADADNILTLGPTLTPSGLSVGSSDPAAPAADACDQEPDGLNADIVTKNDDVDGTPPEPIKPSKRNSKRPPCPQKKILELFNEKCPSLPAVIEWGKTSQANLNARWKEKPERQCVEWWGFFFENYIESSDFLTGRVKDWHASLSWIIKPTNFEKILNKNFVNRNGQGRRPPGMPVRTARNLDAAEGFLEVMGAQCPMEGETDGPEKP